MQYFRGVQGILLVYDITDGESFVRLQDWMDLAGQGADSGGVCMLLVGNKLDKENKREVLESEARNFALQKKVLNVKIRCNLLRQVPKMEQMCNKFLCGQ